MFIAQEIFEKKRILFLYIKIEMTISSQLSVKTYLKIFLARKIPKMVKIGPNLRSKYVKVE